MARTYPALDTVERLADALAVHPAWLAFGVVELSSETGIPTVPFAGPHRWPKSGGNRA